MFNTGNRVLIISAHPDDDILGCGGTISKFSDKIEFRVIFIAEGTSCRYQDPTCQESLEEIEVRNNYGELALNYLGVTNYHFYNLPCGRLDQVPLIEINKIIESEIKFFDPHTILTHSGTDTNKDHCKVYDSTMIATRPCGPVKNVLSYEILSSTEWQFDNTFSPNVFVSLDENDIINKIKALRHYKSEIKDFPYPRSDEGIRTLSQYRGLQSGNKNAESFKLVRSIV